MSSEELERVRRVAIALAGLLVLIALVAIASAGRAPGIGETKPAASAPGFLADYAATLALLMVPLGACVAVWAMFERRVERVRSGGRRPPLLARLVLVALLLALGIGVRLFVANHSPGRHHPRNAVPSVTTPAGQQSNPQKQAQPHFQWLAVLVLGSLLVGVAGSAGVLVLRRRRGTLEPQSTSAALAKVLDETIDDLRSEADPRKAVIRTYARMERTFAARGVPREPFEAPLEYLVRILDVVQANAQSVRRLTHLFERARFSTHSVDEGMKSDAIAAFDALRAELQVAV